MGRISAVNGRFAKIIEKLNRKLLDYYQHYIIMEKK